VNGGTLASPSAFSLQSPASSLMSDLAHADVALVCALHMEISPLFDRCDKPRKYVGGKFTYRGGRYRHIRLAAVECGGGPARARQATQGLIDAHSPDWVVSVGFAGSLVPEIPSGSIFVAETVVDADSKESLAIDFKMPADPGRGLHTGKLVTTTHIVRLVREKQALAEQTGGQAVDMESYAIADVCREREKTFMCVRVITDDTSADLPPEILTIFGKTGTQRAGAVAGAFFKRPSSVKDLWKLRGEVHEHAVTLARFLDGVLMQLVPASEPLK
jgi:adenosylhomocysteine nucleosidase